MLLKKLSNEDLRIEAVEVAPACRGIVSTDAAMNGIEEIVGP